MILNKIRNRFDSSTKLPVKYAGRHTYQSDIRKFIDHIGSKFSSDNAFILKEKSKTNKSVTYTKITYSDFAQEVNALAACFTSKSMISDPIAVIGKNSYPWMLTFFAVQYAGGIIVPLDKALPEGEAISSLKRSHSKVLVYDDDLEKSISAIKESLEAEGENIEFVPMSMLKKFVEEGTALVEGGFENHISGYIDPNEMSIILFTSGTTSTSKAVMLTQTNILGDAHDAIITEDLRHGDVFMAFLPYHHTFGSTGQLIALWAGMTTTYCDGLRYIQKNLVEYKVSVFVGVPALVENLYKKIIMGVRKKGKEKDFAKGIVISRNLMKMGIDVRRNVFSDLHKELGGNLRYIISGASALDPDVSEGLNAIGITTVQGYGLTESAPILAAETPQLQRRGSVGKAMPSVDLDLVDKNEDGIGQLIARGPNIMKGYFENEEATEAALRDGWLYTGDLAYIDEEGFVFIKGREKNVIVLRNGKNVYPEELEKLLEALPFVDEVMVYGENKNDEDADGTNLVVACKIVYNKDVIKRMFDAVSHDEILEAVKPAIEKINDSMPDYKRIRRIHLTDQPMIKTSTGKIKRFEEIKRN